MNIEARDWAVMDIQPRRSMADINKADIPIQPGVYALYRGKSRIYLGKAKSLQNRIWGNHCGRGAVMTGSALRRNIAEHLSIASASDIKAARYRLTAAQVADVRSWLDGCRIAWLTCDSEQRAFDLEAQLKSEDKPHLTKC